MKAATSCPNRLYGGEEISIHAAREGGDTCYKSEDRITEISIHAAREGGDQTIKVKAVDTNDFNPRRP